ncbi:hypothetical protein [Vibrio rotiferianus]|uniref:hypothetical protein n=1 Tax=Vibrio rotiferianus TaxID=190895 RepID=UPI001110D677|nr:hypothetical protein [Vibrio rotiferianus]TMX60929.1 hypothetical protein DA097_16890 [Vibrio rotiferianus]
MKIKEKLVALLAILTSITSLVLLGVLIGSTNVKSFGGNHSWLEIISVLGTLFGGVATTFAAYVAYLALTTWKNEHYWKIQDSVKRELAEAWFEYDLAVTRLAVEQLGHNKKMLKSRDFGKRTNFDTKDEKVEEKFELLVLKARKFDFEFDSTDTEVKAFFMTFDKFKVLDAVDIPFEAITNEDFDVESYVKNAEQAIQGYLVNSKLVKRKVFEISKT